MNNVEELIRIFTEKLNFMDDAHAFDRWASSLLEILFNGHNLLTLGGFLAPQDCSVRNGREIINLNLNGINIDELQSVLDFYQVSELMVINEKAIKWSHGVENWVIISPINYGYSAPIGYYWAVVSADEKEIVKNILHISSLLCSLAVKSEKAFHALECLSRPTWKELNSVESAIRYAADLSVKALLCKAAVVWKIDYKAGQLITVHSVGEKCGNLKVTMPIGNGVAGKCASNAKVYKIDDLWEEEDVVHPILVRDKKLRSGIFVPLDTGSEIIGVLGVYSERVRALSDIDVQIVTSIAQWLTTRLLQQSRIEEAILIKHYCPAIS